MKRAAGDFATSELDEGELNFDGHDKLQCYDQCLRQGWSWSQCLKQGRGHVSPYIALHGLYMAIYQGYAAPCSMATRATLWMNSETSGREDIAVCPFDVYMEAWAHGRNTIGSKEQQNNKSSHIEEEQKKNSTCTEAAQNTKSSDKQAKSSNKKKSSGTDTKSSNGRVAKSGKAAEVGKSQHSQFPI